MNCTTLLHVKLLVRYMPLTYIYGIYRASIALPTADTEMGQEIDEYKTEQLGPSVNKEYLSQIQLYLIFSKLLVMSNTVLIITVCVKIAKSTFLVINKRTKWAELSRYYLYNCFVR